MESSKVGYWLQVGANIGILASLILVAFQINQNTQLARADLTARTYDLAMQMMLTQMGENPLKARAKAAIAPSSLTDEELLVIDSMVTYWWNFDTRLQLLSDQELTMMRLDVDAYMRGRPDFIYATNPVAAQSWKALTTGYELDSVFESIVNAEMAKTKPTADQKRLEFLRQATK
jgi:type II secretory pathway pseudopilin PulG